MKNGPPKIDNIPALAHQLNDPGNDRYWWDYTLDWNLRKRGYPKDGPPDESVGKFPNKNTGFSDFESKKGTLNYREYIQIDKLLDSQIPLSLVPDERVFVIVHQMFELMFKQMIFDLEIVYETLSKLEQFDAATFDMLSKIEIPAGFYTPHRDNNILEDFFRGENSDNSLKWLIEFWQPAIFAANRLMYGAREVLGRLGGLFGPSNFSGLEFAQFRPMLLPASGFQTEQFRTIQRTLGKAPLMNYIIFASHEYLKTYHGSKDAPHSIRNFTNVTDKRVYDRKADKVKRARDGAAHGFPNKQKGLIQCVNRVLSVFYSVNKGSKNESPRQQDESKVAALAEQFEKYLSGLDVFKGYQDDISQKATIDELSLKFVTDLKNDLEKQDALFTDEAKKGAAALFDKTHSKTVLYHILNSLNELDKALHDRANSFLAGHIKMVENQIYIVMKADELNDEVAVQGTGGGGESYLKFMIELYQFFPAFPVFRDIGE